MFQNCRLKREVRTLHFVVKNQKQAFQRQDNFFAAVNLPETNSVYVQTHMTESYSTTSNINLTLETSSQSTQRTVSLLEDMYTIQRENSFYSIDEQIQSIDQTLREMSFNCVK